MLVGRWPPWVWCCPSTTRKTCSPARCKLLSWLLRRCHRRSRVEWPLCSTGVVMPARQSSMPGRRGSKSSSFTRNAGAWDWLAKRAAVPFYHSGPRRTPRESGWRQPMPIRVCPKTGSPSSWRPTCPERTCGRDGSELSSKVRRRCGGRSGIRPNGIRCTVRASVSVLPCTRSLEASAACALGKIEISMAEPWRRAFGSPMPSGRS